MEAKEFLKALSKVAPKKEDFDKYNLPDQYVNQSLETYVCSRKEYNDVLSGNNTVLQLLNLYDCSKMEIGNVRFLKDAIEFDDYFEIGSVEIDILVLNKITLEIEVRDHDSVDYVIWPCTANGGNLLDALILCADFFAAKIKDPALEKNNKYIFDRVNECAEAAGGG